MLKLLFTLLLFTSPLLGWQKKLKADIRSNHPPTWMLDQIREDLSPFSDGISDAMIQSTLAMSASHPEQYLLLNCKIENGQVTITSPYKDHPTAKELQKALN